MMPSTDTDYKQLFSQLIKKQMLVLGPDITLAKVRNVMGITVDVNGDVQKIDGDPQALLQNLINQFVELSGLIVKKTMESILTSYPGMAGIAVTGAFGGVVAPTAPVVSSPQAQNTQTSTMQTSPVVPPSFADMPVQGVTVSPSTPQKPAEPPTFSSNEMEDLNKALEELSKTPLSTESLQPQT
jgi:hypothetical protein